MVLEVASCWNHGHDGMRCCELPDTVRAVEANCSKMSVSPCTQKSGHILVFKLVRVGCLAQRTVHGGSLC